MIGAERAKARGFPLHLAPRNTLETRLLTLASLLESLPDIRSAASSAPNAELDALLEQLRGLSCHLRQRQESAEWDAADQVAARITLQSLATVAVHLRRAAVEARELLTAGRESIRKAADEVARSKMDLACAAGRSPADV